MDYLRSGYRTRARLIQGSEATGFIRWFKAQPGAKVFPHQHAFGSLVWEGDHQQHWEGPGETSRTRSWSKSAGPPLPGTHFHGAASWFLFGVPPSVLATPAPVYQCDRAAQLPEGGGAGGGTGFGGVQVGRGGGAGGGRAQGLGVFPRGGGAGGGVAPQTGIPWIVIPQGGGAGGGMAPQTGNPYAHPSAGGGAGGGVAEQTSGGIVTACRPSRGLPETMWLELDNVVGCNFSAGEVVPMTYIPADDLWRSDTIDLAPSNQVVELACEGTDWHWYLVVSGGAIHDGVPTVVSSDPLILTFSTGVFSASCPMTITEDHP